MAAGNAQRCGHSGVRPLGVAARGLCKVNPGLRSHPEMCSRAAARVTCKHLFRKTCTQCPSQPIHHSKILDTRCPSHGSEAGPTPAKQCLDYFSAIKRTKRLVLAATGTGQRETVISEGHVLPGFIPAASQREKLQRRRAGQWFLRDGKVEVVLI